MKILLGSSDVSIDNRRGESLNINLTLSPSPYQGEGGLNVLRREPVPNLIREFRRDHTVN